MSSPNSAEISGSPSPAPSSIGNNAPKYGTLVPNRIFVGGISASTTEQDLLELFSQYGVVKATKIISDRAGVSKGYGFVTFETEDEARRLTQEADNIMLKDRKLNIAPAIKKQVSDMGYIKTYSPRLVESNNGMVGAGGTVFFSNGATYSTYGNNMPVIGPTEYHPTFTQAPAAAAAAAAAAPPPVPSGYQTIVYQQPMYYTAAQQYQYQPAQTVQTQWGAAPQWRWITPGSYPQPECNSQCLGEPSNVAQRDHTTTAVGSTPNTSSTTTTSSSSSSYFAPATPSKSTSSNTTTATSTTTSVSTMSHAIISTSSASDPSPTMCDSVLLIKPLSVNGKPVPTSDKSNMLSGISGRAVDGNNNLSEDIDGAASSPCHTAQLSQNIKRDLDQSPEVSPASSSPITSVAEDSNTRNGKEKNVAADVQTLSPYRCFESKILQEPLHSCSAQMSPQPELRPSVETYGNSGDLIYISKIDANPNDINFTSSLPFNPNCDAQPLVGHVQPCPHHSEEMAPGQSSVVPQHMSSPLVVIPSWMPDNKPISSLPSNDLNSTSITCRSSHVSKSQVVPPPSAVHRSQMVVSHSSEPAQTSSMPIKMSRGCQLCSTTSLTEGNGSHVTDEVQPSNGIANDGNNLSMSANTVLCTNTVTSSTVSAASLSSATFTVASNAQSICSPASYHSWYPYRPGQPFLTSYPDGSANPMFYGYANQNMWMIVPSHQYWRAGNPCFQWPTPLLTHWPIPPSQTIYSASYGTATSPTYSGTTCMSPMPAEPTNIGVNLVTNFQAMERKHSEDADLAYTHVRSYERRSNYGSFGENSVSDCRAALHGPPLMSSPRVKSGEQNMHRKSKGPLRNHNGKQLPRQNFRMTSSSSPVVSGKPSCSTGKNTFPHNSTRSFNAATTKADHLRLPSEYDDSCGLMPMTPPPTPILKTDSSTTISSISSTC